MTTVTNLGELLGKGMQEVVDEIHDLITSREALSLIIAVEVAGERRPMVAVRGRYERDPYSALTALVRTEHLVQRRLDRLDFQETR
jgi:hypothetical protein